MDDLRLAAVETSCQRQVPADLQAQGSQNSSSPPPPGASLLNAVTGQARKRRANEDMTAYSRTVGRKFKLRKTDQDELHIFAQVSCSYTV